MIRRLLQVLGALLMVIDIIACFLWLAVLYPFGLSARPNGHQMISAYVGRAAINGRVWARRVEGVIDWIFETLGNGPDHCRRAARHYAGFAD